MTDPASRTDWALPGPALGTEGDPTPIPADVVERNFAVRIQEGHSPATPGVGWIAVPGAAGRRRALINSTPHMLMIRASGSSAVPVALPPGGAILIVGLSDAQYGLAMDPLSLRAAIGRATEARSGLMSAADKSALAHVHPGGGAGLNQDDVDARIRNLVSLWALAHADQPDQDGEILKRDFGAVGFSGLDRDDIPPGTIQSRHIEARTIQSDRLDPSIGTLPGGGAANQILAKRSGAAHDVHWEDPPAAGQGGLNASQVGVLIDESRTDDWRGYSDVARGAAYALAQGHTAGELHDTGIDLRGGDDSIKLGVDGTRSGAILRSAIPASTAGVNALLTSAGVEVIVSGQRYRVALDGSRLLVGSETVADSASITALASGWRLERSADRDHPDEAYPAGRLAASIDDGGNVSATIEEGKVRLHAPTAGLTQAQVDARIDDEVEDWARDSTTLIPAGKLGNAPGGASGVAQRIASLSAIPDPDGYHAGEMVDVGGVLYDLVDDAAESNVHRGVIGQLDGSYIGDGTFSFDDSSPQNQRAELPKAALGAQPPAYLAGEVRTAGGIYSQIGLARSAGSDTAADYAYRHSPGDPDLDYELDGATAIGMDYSIAFYSDVARRHPVAVHSGDRWERSDRTGITLSEVRGAIAPEARTGDAGRWPKTKLPSDTVYTDTQRFTPADAVKLHGVEAGALASGSVDGRIASALRGLTGTDIEAADSILVSDASDSSNVRVAPISDLAPLVERTDDEIDALAAAQVVAGTEDWARDSVTPIPASKLAEAPGSTASEIGAEIERYTGQGSSTDTIPGAVLGGGYSSGAGTRILANTAGGDAAWIETPGLTVQTISAAQLRQTTRRAGSKILYIVTS